MKILPISEGTFTVDKTKHFIPFNENEDQLYKRSSGSLLVEIQPFLVITEKDILLLDTGLGFSKNGNMQIHRNIFEVGIDREKVTKVLLTHLHKDHAGGVSMHKNHSELSFPNADYYVQHKELESALKKGFPSFIPEELEVLKNSKQVKLLKNEKGIIDGYIEYEVTAAHSPYHQVFLIKLENKILFFGGDDAPQLHQMKHRFIAKYDFDGRKAMELRKQWWEKGKLEKWVFLFYHDIKTPMYTN